MRKKAITNRHLAAMQRLVDGLEDLQEDLKSNSEARQSIDIAHSMLGLSAAALANVKAVQEEKQATSTRGDIPDGPGGAV